MLELIEQNLYEVQIPRCASFPEGGLEIGKLIGRVKTAFGLGYRFDFNGKKIAIPARKFIIRQL